MDHYEFSTEQMDTVWIGLEGNRLRDLNPKTLLVAKCPELEPTIEQLWLATERHLGQVGPELDALAGLTISQFIRHLKEDKECTSACIDQVIEWMHKHFDQPVTIANLAFKFGYSEGYFYRAFKRQTGTTPTSYLASIRIRHAIHAMRHTTLTVNRIARLVGYEDPLYFRRVFKKIVGQSPTQTKASRK